MKSKDDRSWSEPRQWATRQNNAAEGGQGTEKADEGSTRGSVVALFTVAAPVHRIFGNRKRLLLSSGSWG